MQAALSPMAEFLYLVSLKIHEFDKHMNLRFIFLARKNGLSSNGAMTVQRTLLYN
jgi:hypothetical protein